MQEAYVYYGVKAAVCLQPRPRRPDSMLKYMRNANRLRSNTLSEYMNVMKKEENLKER